MTSSESYVCDIGTSLEHESELHYLLWKVGVEDCASRNATIVEPIGLSSQPSSRMRNGALWPWTAPRHLEARSPSRSAPSSPAYPDYEWDDEFGYLRRKIRERPASDLARCPVSFKTALMRSLGPTLEGTIGPPPDGFKMISPRQILDAAKQHYATVDQMAFFKLEDLLATPLDHIQNFEKHIASQKKHILMQTAAGYPIEEYRQVRIFRKFVVRHHFNADCMRDFDRKFPDPLLHRYSDIVAMSRLTCPTSGLRPTCRRPQRAGPIRPQPWSPPPLPPLLPLPGLCHTILCMLNRFRSQRFCPLRFASLRLEQYLKQGHVITLLNVDQEEEKRVGWWMVQYYVVHPDFLDVGSLDHKIAAIPWKLQLYLSSDSP